MFFRIVMSKLSFLLFLNIVCEVVQSSKTIHNDSEAFSTHLLSNCQSISKAVQLSQSPPSSNLIYNFFMPSRYSASIMTLCNPIVNTFLGSYANTNVTVAKLRFYVDGPKTHYTLMFEMENRKSGKNVQAVVSQFDMSSRVNSKIVELSYKINQSHIKIKIKDKQLGQLQSLFRKSQPVQRQTAGSKTPKFKTFYFTASQLSGYSLVGALLVAIGLLVYHIVFLQQYEPLKIVEFLKLEVSPFAVFPLLAKLEQLGWLLRSSLLTQDCLPYLSHAFQLLLLFPLCQYFNLNSVYSKTDGSKHKVLIVYCFFLCFLTGTFAKEVVFYIIVLIPQLKNRRGRSQMKLWLMTLATMYTFLMLYLYAVDLRRQIDSYRVSIILLLWLLQLCLAFVSFRTTFKSRSNRMTQQECGICLDMISEDELFRTKCNHVFHQQCIWRSVSLKNECPMDRSRLQLSQIEEFMDEEQ